MNTHRNIHLVTGGIRSGKSEYAERLALQEAQRINTRPLYVATAKVYDEEMQSRVQLHKERRADRWDTVEETIHVADAGMSERVVLLDCLTLWITNIFLECDCDVNDALKIFDEEFDKLLESNFTSLYIVTNEVGLGGIPSNEMQRKFADLQGFANQRVAAVADRVTLMSCGLPIVVK